MSDRRPSTPEPADHAPTAAPDDERLLEDLKTQARKAQACRAHFFVSHAAHFLDPLVPEEFEQLRSAPMNARVLEAAGWIVERELGHDQTPRIYFPVPMARALAAGSSWEEVESRFRYDMILIDEDQRWSWRGRPVAERTRAFFAESLRWQPAVGRWFFEYKIHDGWWDKSYLEAEITPLLGLRFEDPMGDGSQQLVLQDGRRVACVLESMRLDHQERLFIRSAQDGEVLLADAERFRILRTADEQLQSVELAGRRVPLRWPEQDE